MPLDDCLAKLLVDCLTKLLDWLSKAIGWGAKDLDLVILIPTGLTTLVVDPPS